MYKHILVAVDGSDTSNLALQEAIKLAKEQRAMLRLVHVVDESPTYIAFDEPMATDPDLIEAIRKALRTTGENLLSKCVAVAREAGIEADTTMKTVDAFGPRIHEAIEEEAARWPADLVVIGTHGRRGFRRLLLGSVAEGLGRVSTKPVLLIRGR
jgi:nucleotide-binding universal stress UspA family protein